MKRNREKIEDTRELYNDIFIKIDKIMREDKLFLDHKISLIKLARIVGTNRTYASRAVCEKYKNFKEYINNLRVDNLLLDVKNDSFKNVLSEDLDNFANKYGFKTRRSLDRVMSRERGCTYSTVIKKKNSLQNLSNKFAQ